MSDSPRAQSYRDKAKRLREKAAHASAPDIRRDLQEIAHRYEWLADKIEQRAVEQQLRQG